MCAGPNGASPVTPRPCALSASFGCTRVPRSAGAVPNSTRRRDRDRRGEAEDAPVERQVEEDRVRRGRQLAHQQAAAPVREQQAQQRAGAREQQAFGQQLPQRCAGAMRRARCAG